MRRNKRENLMLKLYEIDFFNSIDEKRNTEELPFYPDLYSHINEIDEVVDNYIKNYSFDRISFVDRSIIRIAVYEMLYTDLHINIIMNEALELTKKFSNLDDDRQRKFNNKLLDNIYKGIKNG